jgi:predicted nucleic acid-binding protein
MENRLKLEILQESKKYHGNIIIHDETADGLVEPNWESINETSVQTSIDVFNEIKKEFKNVSYFRVTTTPEKSFSIDTFDELFDCLKKIENQGNVIFNCQLGRSRSTMGMVICCLIQSKLQKNEKLLEKVNLYNETDLTSIYLKGEYSVIQNLVILLFSGKKSKSQVDSAIDQCSHIFNYRESIFEFKNNGDKSRIEEKSIYYDLGLKHLEFYSNLIAFNEYLDVFYNKKEIISFLNWLKEVPEVYSLLKLISVSNESILEASEINHQLGLKYTDIVKERKGKVLGNNMILKFDHFIDQIDSFSTIKGCPNFRKIKSEVSLFASSTPNTSSFDGIFQNLKHKKVVFINLRQEPHIYINGEVYCLRSAQSSFENIYFSGVKMKKVEKLEKMLKEDIELESKELKKILVHDETNNKDLVESWIETKDIKTSQEVFSNFKKEGYEIEYYR